MEIPVYAHSKLKYWGAKIYFALHVFISLMLLPVLINAQERAPVLGLSQVSDSQTKTGSDFQLRTDLLDYKARQEAAVSWILDGNIPSFLRELSPVRFQNANNETAVIWVTLDYMSIGVEDDFIRIPLSLPSAQKIAVSLDMYLPTAVIVDSIYAQSSRNLQPIPMKPGKQMRSNDYYRRHNQMIEEQLRGVKKGRLISGHKKDLVVTNRLKQSPGKVAIYGWHYALEDPIQPLSLVHSEDYEDYSHGLRLVHPVAEIGGKAVEFKKLINMEEWAGVFTKEGHIEIDILSHGK